jgi:hypothetical protein
MCDPSRSNTGRPSNPAALVRRTGSGIEPSARSRDGIANTS